tara:strand:+ start:53604 stop:55025 length:1422 start_codon:yes stop_codon:yes gene_type:complete
MFTALFGPVLVNSKPLGEKIMAYKWQQAAAENVWFETAFSGGTFATWSGSASSLAGALSPYLTSSNASSTYLTQSSAASTYLTISNAASTYQTASAMSSYSTTSQMNTAIAAAVSGAKVPTSWLDPVQSTVSSAPSGPSSGDRHLCSGSISGVSGTAAGDIIEYNGSAWTVVFDSSADGEEGVMFYHQGLDQLYFLPSGGGTWQQIGSALGGDVMLDSEFASAFASAVASDSTIAANTAKVSNVSTNLSNTASTTAVTIHSSDGNDTSISAASTSAAGVMTAAHATAIAANTAKDTFPGFGTSSGTALEGNTTTITGAQASAIAASTSGVASNLSAIGTINNLTTALGASDLVAAVNALASRQSNAGTALDPADASTGYTISSPGKYWMQGTLSADATLTLPASSGLSDGATIGIKLQGLGSGKHLTVDVNSADSGVKIDGQDEIDIDVAYAALSFVYQSNSDGNNTKAWMVM